MIEIIFASLILLLVRNAIVYRASLKALDMVSAMAKMAIHEDQPWEWLYRRLEENSYYLDVLDLRKWTFRQFFPWLAND